MTQIFDKEIGTYEQELTLIVQQMEKIRQGFLTTTVAFVQRWYQNTARFHVQNKYNHTIQLGGAKISEMKRRVQELVARTPDSAEQLVAHDSVWWHKSRGGGWQNASTGDVPEGLEKALFRLVVQLVPILKVYGYINANAAAEGESSGLEQLDLEWPQEMMTQIENYRKQVSRALALDSRIKRATQDKLKFEAGALWDKAE